VSRRGYESSTFRRWLSLLGHNTARYGAVWSTHIELEPEAELELTLAEENWASVHPIDPGTRHVVMDAFKILIDKDGALERLRNACV
jgi:hypothetical protein